MSKPPMFSAMLPMTLLRVVCALAIAAAPLAQDAAARPSSSSSSSSHSSSRSSSSSSGSKSFSGGFSSRKSSSPSSSSSFSPSSSSTSSASSSTRPSGGFGSFGQRASAPAPQQSDSALSKQLSRQQAESNALRTLDARRGATDTQPARAPADRGTASATAPAPAPMPAPTYGGPQPYGQAPVVVHQDSGFGNLVTGYVLGRMANSHSNGGYARGGYNGNGNGNYNGSGNGGYPAPVGTASAGTSLFGAFLRVLAWIAALALLVWAVVAVRRRLRQRREENKPNYSFQRRG